MRVLVADDEDQLRQLIVEVLLDAGFDVYDSAGHDEDAVHQASALLPDVVVLDYMMPGLNGVEVARRIHGLPELSHVRIVAMTAASRTEWVCQEMRANACLSKPFDIDVLVNAVRTGDMHGHAPRLSSTG